MQGLWLTLLLQLAIPVQGQYLVRMNYKDDSCGSEKNKPATKTAMKWSTFEEGLKGTENEMKCKNHSGVYGKMLVNTSGCFYGEYSDSDCSTLIGASVVMTEKDAECEKDDHLPKVSKSYKMYCQVEPDASIEKVDCVSAADIKAGDGMEAFPECMKDCTFASEGPANCADLTASCMDDCNSTVVSAVWSHFLYAGGDKCSCSNPKRVAATSFGVNMKPSTLMEYLSMLMPLLATAAQ